MKFLCMLQHGWTLNKQYSKWNNPDKKGKYCMIPLIWNIYTRQRFRTESRLEIIRNYGKRRMGSYWLTVTEFLLGVIKVLTIDGSDGCTILWMFLMPLDYTPKMGEMVNFMFIYIFHPNKKITELKNFYRWGSCDIVYVILHKSQPLQFSVSLSIR